MLAVSRWTVALIASLCWSTLEAEPAVAVRGTVGASRIFLDEPAQFTAGGSLRVHVVQRFSVEPEFLTVRGSRFEQWSFVPNVVYDFAGPGRRVVTYLIGGVGFLRCRDKRINYTSDETTGSGGIGVRIFVSERLFLSPEIRIGSHAFPRATMSVGYSF